MAMTQINATVVARRMFRSVQWFATERRPMDVEGSTNWLLARYDHKLAPGTFCSRDDRASIKNMTAWILKNAIERK